MIKYVLLYVENPKNEEIVVVEKQKPEFLRGKLNLIGGKIEDGETPDNAAMRELKEETALISRYHSYSGLLYGEGFEVYCFYVVTFDENINPQDTEVEIPYWESWHRIKRLDSTKLMENLKVIVPLIKSNGSEWKMTKDEITGEYKVKFV